MLGRAKYCCNTYSCALSQTHCRQDRLGTATVATTVIFPRSPRIDLFVLFYWGNVHTDINMNENIRYIRHVPRQPRPKTSKSRQEVASGSAPAQALASCQCGRNRHGFTTPTSFAATATSSLTRASDVLPRPWRPRAGNGSHAIAESSPKESHKSTRTSRPGSHVASLFFPGHGSSDRSGYEFANSQPAGRGAW